VCTIQIQIRNQNTGFDDAPRIYFHFFHLNDLFSEFGQQHVPLQRQEDKQPLQPAPVKGVNCYYCIITAPTCLSKSITVVMFLVWQRNHQMLIRSFSNKIIRICLRN